MAHVAPNLISNITIEATNVIEEILEDAVRPIVSTKFGPESAAFLHMLTRIVPDIPVVWVDTGYNTRSTLQFAGTCRNCCR